MALTIQTRVCTRQNILLCWTRVPCDVIIKRRIIPLNKISQYVFLLILAYDLALGRIHAYILSTGYVAHLHSDMEIERRV